MTQKMQFFPLNITYKIIDDKPVVHLFGRTTDDQQIILLDDSFEPYFYVVPKPRKNVKDKLEKIEIDDDDKKAKVTKTEIVRKKILGKEKDVIKVYTQSPKEVPILKNIIKDWNIIEGLYEYDILYNRRYLVDKRITPFTLYEAEVEPATINAKVPAYNLINIEQVSTDALNPRILSFDIETYATSPNIEPEKNPIIMIALYSHSGKGKPFRKVFVWKKFKTDLDYVTFVDSEVELIEAFKETIETLKPDILTGYFSDGFDLPYIKTRADKYKIELNLGLDLSELIINKKNIPKAIIRGIVHLDVFRFIRRVMAPTLNTDSYNLNAVAKELLGEVKKDVDIEELYNVWDNKPNQLGKFCEYNLTDAKLTFNLAQRVLPTLIELVKIVGLPADDINRMGFSQLVEWYLINQAQEYNEIAPNKPSYNDIRERRTKSFKGAYVYEPKPGLYKDIVVFDYRSLYPTIIASHNISLGKLKCECCEETAKKTPTEEEYWFCSKKKGFIPTMIEDLITRRMRIKEIVTKKEEKNENLLNARQNSLKLLANSFYGYLGFYGARWYCLECAKATTAWGRYYIQDVIKKAEKKHFKVLYSDSLPYDRFLFVKFKSGDIKLIKIGELFDKYRKKKNISTIALDNKNRVVFKKINRVIRHMYDGKLLKFNTNYGSTVVTPQHSIYSYNEKTKKVILTDAKKLKKGDNLISLTNQEDSASYYKDHIFDVVDFSMGNYSDELMLYSDNLMFPNKKGICPYCNANTRLSSHVFHGHPERREKIRKGSKFNWVGGVHAKTRKIPRYWKLDNELAWILGFYCAEGSVSDIKTKSGRKCLLSFGSQNRMVIQRVKKILDFKTGVSTKIIENIDKRTNKKMYYYRVQCIPIVALFKEGFGLGSMSEFKKVPWFIFSSERTLRESFLYGYLEGDGQKTRDKRYTTDFIRFSTKSKELAMGISFLLKTLRYKKNARGKSIRHVAWQYRKDKPKIQTLRFQSAKNCKGNYCLSPIRSIKEISAEKYVYDVEVEKAHNFVDAEGMILVHNTDSVFLSLDGKTKETAIKFVDKINTELPGLMELEYEGYYPEGIFVSAKVGDYGAKKKYALLSESGNLTIKGFETVRRNWSDIAKETQEKVLEIILKKQDKEKALKYVKKVINNLRNNKVKLDKVTIHTQLQKDLKDYASRGPHVAVAQQLKNKGVDVGPGALIKYIVTKGSGTISNRSKIPEDISQDDYDSDYYINNQVIPAVEQIFKVMGFLKDDLVEHKEQKKLDRFI